MEQTVEQHIRELRSAKDYFDRSTACLAEEDGTFRPKDEMMTAAQHVAHVAQTVEWFFEGAFQPEGFDVDFEKLMADVMAVESLSAARRWLDEVVERACAQLEASSEENLDVLLPADSVMGAIPRRAIIGAILDHTAHHRGALTVYSRLLGHVPAMPYVPDST